MYWCNILKKQGCFRKNLESYFFAAVRGEESIPTKSSIVVIRLLELVNGDITSALKDN